MRLCPNWAQPRCLNLRCLRKRECIVDINTQVPHGVLDLAMPEQYLNGSEIARGLVDDRRLGSAQGMGARSCPAAWCN